ncbi:PleD family two-component system response regulator [Candidatus Aenigmatarchaeota archaeon]
MVKILVVDDEKDIRLLIRTLLEAEGYDVVNADCGKAALKELANDKYDLVLLDFFMPEMSGRQVMDKMQEDSKLKKTKVIFLTVATFSQTGAEELKKCGCLDYIRKPIDNEDFMKRVKKVLK